MTVFPWSDVLIIAGLILLNGLFSMSELAILSARKEKLQALSAKGSRAAKTALMLQSEPGKFLSTVQIGITLVGIIAGAYSGASLGAPMGLWLEQMGVASGFARDAGFALVIALTTYFSLVVGELVPKQMALRSAQSIALAMAQPMALLARLAAPIVWLLDASSNLLLRVLRVKRGDSGSYTAEELQMVIADATRSGVIEQDQHSIVAGAVRLAQRSVREMMTPRTEMDWIDANTDRGALEAAIEQSPHSLLPLADGSPDTILGVVKVREVLALMVAGRKIDLRALAKKAEIVPDQLDAMDALRVLQQSDIAMAMVHDEYGHLDGIVTPVDLLTALVGRFVSDQDEGDAPNVTEEADGSLLISGMMGADDLADQLDIHYESTREFATAAGFVLSILKKLPLEGEQFSYQKWNFEVLAMDGRRIDRLRARRLEEPGGARGELTSGE